MIMTSENPYAGQGSVLLDIGEDIGALVVTMPADLEGVEVEINRVGATDHRHPVGDQHDHHHATDHHHDHGSHRSHVAVVARPAAAGVIPSLVFPELTEGRYELYRRPAGTVEMTVTNRGGQVTEASWPNRS
jgi:ABC-type Zn2+ transport system substrate-binding protein/surface adhesin